MTPYQYVANNPILFIDVNGDSVDVSNMKAENAQTLKSSLATSTGLSLCFGENGQMSYDTDEKGNPVVNTNEKGKKVGSKKARKDLMKAIDSKETLTVTDKDGRGSFAYVAKNEINLSPTQIGELMNNVSGGLEKESVGWGMTFFHEYSHTPMGGGTSDPPKIQTIVPGESSVITTGGAVDYTNTIRGQLGYKKRSLYFYKQTTLTSGSVRSILKFGSKGRTSYTKTWNLR
jgi:hypothetical protein